MGRLPFAGEQFFHTLPQLRRPERFGHEVVDTWGGRGLGDFAVSGEHQCRCLTESPDPTDGFETVEVRQSVVHDENIGVVLPDSFDTGGTRSGFMHREASPRQNALNKAPDVFVVINNYN